MGEEQPGSRGVLYPDALPTFHRFAPDDSVADRVRHFWLPEWDLPDGVVSRQTILGYPATSLVVHPDRVTLSGPSMALGHQDLTGRGWVVGAQLRPGGLESLCERPAEIVDREVPCEGPELQTEVLQAEVLRAMTTDPDVDSGPAVRRECAVAVLTRWLAARPAPSPDALLANELSRLIEEDAEVLRLDDAAQRLHISRRTAQRLAARFIGVSPVAMVRRRRIQLAAQSLRESPGVALADLAREVGYADHAHLTRDFRAVLGCSPTEYRAGKAV